MTATKYEARLTHERRRPMRAARNIKTKAPRRGRLPKVVDLSWRCYDARAGHEGMVYDNHAFEGDGEYVGDDGKGQNFFERYCVRCNTSEGLASHDV